MLQWYPSVDVTGGGVSEAPNDGIYYARHNLGWANIAAVFAPIASPVFTGTPQAPTPPPSDNSTKIATTAFVQSNTAPLDADYLVKTSNPTLSAERIVTDDTNNITWDWTVAGQVKAIIAPNSVTYSKMQDITATSRILGRRTAGAGDPEECTLSQALDFIGSPTQGDLLYRDAAAWARLPAGTTGQVLQTQGAGANPLWATAGGGNVSNSGTPTANQLARWVDATHIKGTDFNVVLRVFTVGSGTYTPTTGMVFCIAEALGPGGGGGGVQADPAYILGGGGGAAGGRSIARLTAVQIGANKPYTVGAGGSGGNTSGSAGAGGTAQTSLSSFCIANPGGGGSGMTTAGGGAGGAGGAAGTGDVTATGEPGGNGLYWSSAPSGFGPPAGMGASSPYGGGGVAAVGSSTGAGVNGNNGTGFGSGGSGGSCNKATTSTTGGSGANGLLLITEFCLNP
jgi:hypothetical protein